MGRNGIDLVFFSLPSFPFRLGVLFFLMTTWPTTLLTTGHLSPRCLNCSSSLVVIGALSEWESIFPPGIRHL